VAKKLPSILTAKRLNAPSPFSYVDHTHDDFPPVVADITARDAFAVDRRYEGVIVYVQSDQTTYQLRGGVANSNWITLVTVTGVASHTTLGDIGTNSHVAIDSHIADATLHFTQAAISITESQISDLQAYSLPSHNHDATYLGIAAPSASTNALESLTSTVNVSLAAEPLAGQVLMAVDCDTATWQFVSGAGGAGDIVQTGSPANTYVAYFTADKNLSGDAGMTWITASARLNITGINPVIRLQDSNSTGVTMLNLIEFYDSTVLIGEVGYITGAAGDLSLKNTVGDIQLDTNGTANVIISGNGDLDIGGYLIGYAGLPSDGDFLTWVTANSRAEFVTPTVVSATGTPVDNQIAVFDSVNTVVGDANFLWTGTVFTADGLVYNSANDQLTLGSADLQVPGLVINGSATASPFVNLQQNSVTIASFRYDDADTRLEVSSASDNIAIRPGNVDMLVVTSALTTLSSPLTVTGYIEAGTEILFTEMADHVFTPVAGRGIVWLRDDANGNKLIFSDDEDVDWVLNTEGGSLTQTLLLMGG